MEYERTPDGQIQVAFALRAGLLLRQYQELTAALPTEVRFESTLSVALLQSMLTICQELLESFGQRGRMRSGTAQIQTLAGDSVTGNQEAGLVPEHCVLEAWKSVRSLKAGELLTSLRHALSHPGDQRRSPYPRTGFTTELTGQDIITAYLFTHSPWIRPDGSDVLPRFMPRTDDEQGLRQLQRQVKVWRDDHGVEGLVIKSDASGHFTVFNGDSPFIPVLRLRLEPTHLSTLVTRLSDVLSPALSGSAQGVQP